MTGAYFMPFPDISQNRGLTVLRTYKLKCIDLNRNLRFSDKIKHLLRHLAILIFEIFSILTLTLALCICSIYERSARMIKTCADKLAVTVWY